MHRLEAGTPANGRTESISTRPCVGGTFYTGHGSYDLIPSPRRGGGRGWGGAE